MRKVHLLLALGMIVAPLASAPVFAQAPMGQAACPPGTQLVPPSRDGAGNPVAAYCASAPAGVGRYDPYTGRNAPDPNATPSDGPGQYNPRSR